LLGAEAGIDQQPDAAAVDDCRIARAATSQNDEPHHAAEPRVPSCKVDRK
jgi:hypothetical protein